MKLVLRKIGDWWPVVLLLVSVLFFLWSLGLKNDKIINSFFSTPLDFPDTVLRVKAGKVDIISFPKSQLRMVYYYGSSECMDCCIYHAYELSRSFKDNRYVTIPLFFPESDEFTDVVSDIQQRNYDFPIYVIIGDNKKCMSLIPDNEEYHSFLVGCDDVPLLVGDPVHNAKDAEKFETTIQMYGYQ